MKTQQTINGKVAVNVLHLKAGDRRIQQAETSVNRKHIDRSIVFAPLVARLRLYNAVEYLREGNIPQVERDLRVRFVQVNFQTDRDIVICSELRHFYSVKMNHPHFRSLAWFLLCAAE